MMYLVGLLGLLTMSTALLGCSKTEPTDDGLLLAYATKVNLDGHHHVHVVQSIATKEGWWSTSTPWVDAGVPKSDVVAGGVSVAAGENSRRIIGWNAGAAARFRQGVNAKWEASFYEQARDSNATSQDSAPSIAQHGTDSWLIARRLGDTSATYVYREGAFQTQSLGAAAFTSTTRARPVVATNGDRFLIANTLLGNATMSKLQIVTGNTTASGIANAKRFNPVYCVPPECPVVMPTVTDDSIADDGASLQFVAIDVAVADSAQNGFLMALLEVRAQPDVSANDMLVPVVGEQVTLKVLRTSNTTFNRGDEHSVWSAVTTQSGLAAGSAQFVQVVSLPGESNGILVLTVGPKGKTGWRIAAGEASAVALSADELAAMFSEQPDAQPFSLVRVGGSRK